MQQKMKYRIHMQKHLGEVTCDNAAVDGGILYVRKESTDKYEEMLEENHLDMAVRTLGGLKLRHELEMREVYEDKGVIDIGSVWDSSEEHQPVLKWKNRTYDDRPHHVNISG